MTDITGKTFLVTGATGALGSLIAKQLSEHGAALTLSARSIDSLPDDAHRVPADLKDPGAPQALIDATVKEHGGLDGVIIASGIAAFGPAAEVTDDTVDDLLLVDYLAPLRLTRAALAVINEGGVILNISAVLAENPVGHMAAYSAAKSAASAFFRATKPEARRNKIRVVDVRPPHTETGLVDRAIAGDAPKMPKGLDPQVVADRIVEAILGDETDVPSSAFGK